MVEQFGDRILTVTEKSIDHTCPSTIRDVARHFGMKAPRRVRPVDVDSKDLEEPFDARIDRAEKRRTSAALAVEIRAGMTWLEQRSC